MAFWSLLRGSRTGEYRSPKTVLGFFAGVLVILSLAGGGAISVLATNDALHKYVPLVLAFVAFVFVVILAVVVVALFTDPAKLLLGETTLKDYAAYQKLLQGDSSLGEQLEALEPMAGKVAPKATDELRMAPKRPPLGGQQGK